METIDDIVNIIRDESRDSEGLRLLRGYVAYLDGRLATGAELWTLAHGIAIGDTALYREIDRLALLIPCAPEVIVEQILWKLAKAKS